MTGKKWIVVGTALAALALLMVASAQAGPLVQEPKPQGELSPQDMVGTAFTYQGRLKDASGLVNRACDFQFSLWDALSGGSKLPGTLTKTNVTVSEGLFTVELDWGGFWGEALWLQIAVRCPAGSGAYATLSPRQPLTAVPYALSLRPGAYIANTGSGTGISLSSDHYHGVYVSRADDAGVYVYQADTGLSVRWAYNDGVDVERAGYDGVSVNHALEDGVDVDRAGSPSTAISSTYNNGFEVAGAEGYGLYVGQADKDGVYVRSAGGMGVYAYASGTGSGVFGVSASGIGVYGSSTGSGAGVRGYSYSGPAISAEGTGAIQSTAQSHLFVPAALAAPAPGVTDITITPWYNGGIEVQKTSGGAGVREVLIPITIPGMLYGQEVEVQQITVYYKCSSASSYIDHTFLVKQTGASTWTELVNNDTDHKVTTDTSYSVSVSTGGLSANAGPLSLNLWLSFANNTDKITIGGVRVTVGHD